jgi:YD repeat-containing protein
MKNGVRIGLAPIRMTTGMPMVLGMPIFYDLTRDDGQVIRFTQISGTVTAPAAVTLKMQVTGNGYTVTDANDSVEQYNANGVLLSIASRSGVVQTMTYDGVGRLSVVRDSFGHQLTLSYDAQSRIESVTRQ